MTPVVSHGHLSGSGRLEGCEGGRGNGETERYRQNKLIVKISGENEQNLFFSLHI